MSWKIERQESCGASGKFPHVWDFECKEADRQDWRGNLLPCRESRQQGGTALTDKELSQQAKDYFEQIRKTDRLIQRLTSTAAALRLSLTSQNYELKPDKVQSSGAKNPLESAMSKIIELEKTIQTRKNELSELQKEAFDRIKKVPGFDQQNVLIARYFEKKRWEQIALDLNFSVRQIHRIHGAGLLAFAENNPDILKDGTQCHSQT